MKKRCKGCQGLKKGWNMGDVFEQYFSVTERNNSLRSPSPYTLCRDCSHTFVSFQTVISFCDRVSQHYSKTSPLFPFFFQPYVFFHIVINVFTALFVYFFIYTSLRYHQIQLDICTDPTKAAHTRQIKKTKITWVPTIFKPAWLPGW